MTKIGDASELRVGMRTDQSTDNMCTWTLSSRTCLLGKPWCWKKMMKLFVHAIKTQRWPNYWNRKRKNSKSTQVHCPGACNCPITRGSGSQRHFPIYPRFLLVRYSVLLILHGLSSVREGEIARIMKRVREILAPPLSTNWRDSIQFPSPAVVAL